MIQSVPDSHELRRILALPVRTWSDADMTRLAAWLTDQLRTSAVCDRCGGSRAHVPGVCGYAPHEAPPLALRGIQAVILWELYRLRGVYGQVPVGGGKSLITYLAAYVLGCHRPLLFVPAALVKDTYTKFEIYSRYWVQPRPMPAVESYQMLTQAGSIDMLERRMPDGLFGDECDKWKALERSGAKRIGRYVDLVRERCACLFLSGTAKRKSIRDDAHFAVWALREKAPVPLFSKELTDWRLAIDEDSIVGQQRLRPGALVQLCEQFGLKPEYGEAPSIGELARVREAYSLRFASTPGIIVHDQTECDQPLTIDFEVAPHDDLIEEDFRVLRTTWTTPAAIDVIEERNEQDNAFSMYRVIRELGSGFCYYWDPAAPKEWLAARKNWFAFVRSEIERTSHMGRDALDTMLAVERAHPDHPWLSDWQRIKPTFEPNSVPMWRSASVFYAAAMQAQRWKEAGETGLIWVKHNAAAGAIASIAGLPFYGAKGERIDQYGRPCPDETIEEAVRAASKAGKLPPIAVVGFDSNHRGRNLQAYCNSMIVGWEQSASAAEQFLGRMHRSGQTRPCRVTVLVTCGEILDSFQQTLSEARFVKSQKLTQKIVTATIDRRNARNLPSGYRWLRKHDN